MNKFPQNEWVDIDGQRVPFTKPQHYIGENNEEVRLTGEKDPLPVKVERGGSILLADGINFNSESNFNFYDGAKWSTNYASGAKRVPHFNQWKDKTLVVINNTGTTIKLSILSNLRLNSSFDILRRVTGEYVEIEIPSGGIYTPYIVTKKELPVLGSKLPNDVTFRLAKEGETSSGSFKMSMAFM